MKGRPQWAVVLGEARDALSARQPVAPEDQGDFAVLVIDLSVLPVHDIGKIGAWLFRDGPRPDDAVLRRAASAIDQSESEAARGAL